MNIKRTPMKEYDMPSINENVTDENQIMNPDYLFVTHEGDDCSTDMGQPMDFQYYDDNEEIRPGWGYKDEDWDGSKYGYHKYFWDEKTQKIMEKVIRAVNAASSASSDISERKKLLEHFNRKFFEKEEGMSINAENITYAYETLEMWKRAKNTCDEARNSMLAIYHQLESVKEKKNYTVDELIDILRNDWNNVICMLRSNDERWLEIIPKLYPNLDKWLKRKGLERTPENARHYGHIKWDEENRVSIKQQFNEAAAMEYEDTHKYSFCGDFGRYVLGFYENNPFEFVMVKRSLKDLYPDPDNITFGVILDTYPSHKGDSITYKVKLLNGKTLWLKENMFWRIRQSED